MMRPKLTVESGAAFVVLIISRLDCFTHGGMIKAIRGGLPEWTLIRTLFW
jgi:hypothetical protein